LEEPTARAPQARSTSAAVSAEPLFPPSPDLAADTTPARRSGVSIPSPMPASGPGLAPEPVAASAPIGPQEEQGPAHSRGLQMALIAAVLVLPAIVARLMVR